MLILTGYIHLAAADVTEFVADMAAVTPAARSRGGCLFFAVAPEDPGAGQMLVAERWRDRAAIDAHLAAPDTVAFVARWAGRMRSDNAESEVQDRRSGGGIE